MDELGNTETSYFQVTKPIEQVKATSQERAMVKSAVPMIEELIERFTKRITFYDTLSSVKADVLTTPEEHLRLCIANDQTKTNLIQEKEYLEGLLAAHQ